MFWVETLYDVSGAVLVEGICGAPGETTVIDEQPEQLTVSTMAVAEVTLGEPAHDVAIVSGTVPVGATLTFEAYRQDSETPMCTADTLMFTSSAQLLDGSGQYQSEEVVFEHAGIYYWTETLHDHDGEVLHRGLCGAPNETTTVLPRTDCPASGRPSEPGTHRRR